MCGRIEDVGYFVYGTRVIILELTKDFPEVFMQRGNKDLPGSAREQAPGGFSRDPKQASSFWISSVLNTPIAKFFLMCSCLPYVLEACATAT